MKTLRFAIIQILPLLAPYLFVGVAFGVLINQAGYPAAWAFFSSAFIYAGSMQIIMVPLLSAGAPLYMLAIMTFLVNARHIFYGIGFIDRFRSMGWRYPYMALTLTDEVYSILCAIKYPDDIDPWKADFMIALLSHLLWILSSTAGALLGQALPVDLTGIDFSATAFFATVCVSQWMGPGSRIPALTGLACAAGFMILVGADRFLLPALSASLVLLLFLKDFIGIRMGGAQYDN